MASRVYKKIDIILKSDLCAGSGYSFAGVIDSDVCYDDCGIPYIPARRIKGCMRESLDLLLYSKYHDQTARVFGTSGSSDYEVKDNNSGSSIRISNAYPKYYDELRALINSKKKVPYYSSAQIVDRFSRVIGQTRIKDGVADDSTLRYTRVINQYSPFNKEEPLVFSAEISYDKNDEELVEDILKATRHIGLKRNRGMGNIRCKLAEANRDNPGKKLTEENLPDGKTALYFGIENTSPLVLSASSETGTEDYISGQSIIGALALEFLKTNSADSEVFNNLFLNGNTIFTNFYPYINGKIHYPAPEYIKRLKITKDYVCALAKDSIVELKKAGYDPTNGNQPKKLKGKYVSITNNRISACEVERDIVYHHRHHDESGSLDEALLYGMEVIRSRQRFAGAIIVPDQYKKTMVNLLQNADLSFGKSRSAQYGSCRIIKAHDKSFWKKTDKKISKGRTIVVTFLSDAAFIRNGDNAGYTIYEDEIKELVKKELEKEYKIKIDNKQGDSQYLSYLQTAIRMGYMGVWNLRRSAFPVISAGSCLTYVLAEDCDPGIYRIGEKQHEGFGTVLIEDAEIYKCGGLEEADDKNDDSPQSVITGSIKEFFKPILIDRWIEKEQLKAINENKIRVNISNSTLGRITLMLTESVEENKGENGYISAFESFVKRIRSIKSDAAKSDGLRIVKLISTENRELKPGLGFRKEDVPEYKELSNWLGYSETEINKMLEENWADYLLTLLVDRKYKGRLQDE